MLKYSILLLLIVIFIISCTTKESLVEPTNKNQINGKWEVKFFINNVEQSTSEPSYLTFGVDSSFAYSNTVFYTSNNLISWKFRDRKYKIIPFENYKNLSIDYALYLKDSNITENDCTYVLDIGYHEVSYLNKNVRNLILEFPLGIKLWEKDSIILFPLIKNRDLEIRLRKQ